MAALCAAMLAAQLPAYVAGRPTTAAAASDESAVPAATAHRTPVNADRADRALPNTGTSAATRARIVDGYGKLPMAFEPSARQDRAADFIARGDGYTVATTAGGPTLWLRNAVAPIADGDMLLGWADASRPEYSAIHMRLIGADPSAAVVGAAALPGRINYLIGNDASAWRTELPIFAKVRYASVWPGVDVAYYGMQRQLEFDVVLSAGADPSVVKLAFDGASSLRVLDTGELRLGAGGGTLTLLPPAVYQDIDGARHDVGARYVTDGDTVGFQVEGYDGSRSLVIDPVISYSTYLGAAGLDLATAIAVDSAGNAYVAGITMSSAFPTTPGAYNTTGNSVPTLSDAFVTKLDPTGTSLVYSTYIGGSDGDFALGVAVDGAGNAYVTGRTFSTNFPTTPGAYLTAGGTSQDAFVTKLNPSGSGIVYSTYLGGAADDSANGIAVGTDGTAYVVGTTASSNFPDTVGSAYSGGTSDAFVTRINSTGSSLVYSRFLGGSGPPAADTGPRLGDQGKGIALDGSGNAYVTGWTDSTNFPTTPGALFTTHQSVANADGSGFSDAFVTKLDATGALAYSTFLGGQRTDGGEAIAIDSSGNAYITGGTASLNFPLKNAFDTSYNFGGDAFFTKLNASGSALLYSTYLGGADGAYDTGTGIATTSDYAEIVGLTDSASFPTASPTQARGGARDAFVTEINTNASGAASLTFSTYLGGSGNETDRVAVAIGPNGLYVAGTTASSDFPTTAGAYDQTYNGGSDAFAVLIIPSPLPDLIVTSFTAPSVVRPGQTASYTWTIKNVGTATAVAGPLSWDDQVWLSTSPTSIAGASPAGGIVAVQSLAPGQSYTRTFSATMPNLAPGSYYFVLQTDSNAQIAESNETNNLFAVPVTFPFVVNTAADHNDGSCDSDCTLREAINAANARAGFDVIAFDIAGTGPFTISPASELPTITDAVEIRGPTQPSGAPLIRIDGAGAGVSANGLLTTANGTAFIGLSVTRFIGAGIQLSSSLNTVKGAWLGLAPDGSAAGNATGLAVFGDSNTIGGVGAPTIVSANPGAGIQLGTTTVPASNNTVVNTYIGLDPSGTLALPNGTGIQIDGSTNTVGSTASTGRNVISGNTGAGLIIDSGTGNTVIGNYIGTNAAGSAALGNGGDGIWIRSASNSVGGFETAKRNIISGNGRHGIVASPETAHDNLIQNNYIGPDASGLLDITNATTAPGGGVGVFLEAPSNLVDANLISGNGTGVFIAGSIGSDGLIRGRLNSILANQIGISATFGSLGNSYSGVEITGSNNQVGGNVVKFNGRAGVAVRIGTGNVISSNHIGQNSGLAIDLGDDGRTPNDAAPDADTGANGLQNFPVITDARSDATSTRITFSLASAPNTAYKVEFFSDPSPSGGVNARSFAIGNATVTTDGNGAYAGTVPIATAVAPGQYLLATATDPSGNTSELSDAAPVFSTAPRIAGTVRDNNHNALAGVTVSAIDTADDSVATTALTDTLGVYSLTVQNGHAYDILFTPAAGSGLAPQVYNGQLSALGATGLFVNGSDVLGIDATLVPGYAVTGTVTDTSGHPLAGITVDAYLGTGCCFVVRSTTTDDAGHYLLELADGATYAVRFAGGTPLEAWWQGHANPGGDVPTGWSSANKFSVVATTTTPVTTTTTSCSGNQSILFNNWNGAAVSNNGSEPSFTINTPFCAAYQQNYHWNGGQGATPGQIGVRGPSGNYSANALGSVGSSTPQYPAGVPNANWYYRPPLTGSGIWVMQPGTWFCTDSDHATWSQTNGLGFCEVDGVPYVTTTTTTFVTSTVFGHANTDAQLTAFTQMTGAARNAAGMTLQGINVRAFAADASGVCCRLLAKGTTNADGNYSFSVPLGPVKLLFSSPPNVTYAATWSGNARDFLSAATLQATAGQVLRADVTMPTGLVLSGRISDVATGGAIAGSATLYLANRGNTTNSVVDVAFADETGTYWLVATGGAFTSYKLAFAASLASGYIRSFWNGRPSYATADSFTLTAATTVDGALARGVTINGSLRDRATGSPLQGIIEAYGSDGALVTVGGNSFNVPRGILKFRFVAAGYAPLWWTSSLTPEAATAVDTSVAPLPSLDVLMDQAQTDLSVSVVGPDRVGVTNAFDTVITVRNNGNAASSGRLSHTLPVGLTFVAVTASQGACTGYDTGIGSCDIGSIPPQGSATFTVRARAAQPGTFTQSIALVEDGADANPGNDHATLTTTVPADGVITGTTACINATTHATILLPRADVSISAGSLLLARLVSGADGYYTYGLAPNSVYTIIYRGTTTGQVTAGTPIVSCGVLLRTALTGVTQVAPPQLFPDLGNHSYRTAYPLVNGASQPDYLTLPRASDWYVIHVGEGEKITVDLSSSSDLTLALYGDIVAAASRTPSTFTDARLAGVGVAPGSDAALAPGSDAALAPGSDASLAPGSDAALAPGSDASLAPGSDASLAPGSDASLAPGSDASLAPGSDASLAPGSDAALAPGSDASLAPGSDASLAPGSDAALAPGSDASLAPGSDAALAGGDYSSQVRSSLLAISANRGAGVPERTVREVFDRPGNYYIRVLGQPSTAQLSIKATVQSSECADVVGGLQTFEPSWTNGRPTATPKTLILINSAALRKADGTALGPAELNALLDPNTGLLTRFAARPEVGGVILDLASDTGFTQAMAQWTGHPSCALAANVAADVVRSTIMAYRTTLPSALEYLVIVGPPNAIPHRLEPDRAIAGSETLYAPPVDNLSRSEAQLRRGKVETDDYYAAIQPVDKLGELLYVPDLAVGRLVESYEDISGALDAYLETSDGVIELDPTMGATPRALVTSYDFLAVLGDKLREAFVTSGMTVDQLQSELGVKPTDPAIATTVTADIGAGLQTVTPASMSGIAAGGILLIDAGTSFEVATVSSVTATSFTASFATAHAGTWSVRGGPWTADDLRRALLGSGHYDIVGLNAHFSAGTAWAADLGTLGVTEIPNDGRFKHTLVLSNGCHAGYVVDALDAIAGLTQKVDWAQTFVRQGANLIAGTGYMYGGIHEPNFDQIVLLNTVARLRAGTGAVAIGKALALAKQDYSNAYPGTLDLTDLKALREVVLYGLPMTRYDLGGRTPAPAPAAIQPTLLHAGGTLAVTEIQAGPSEASTPSDAAGHSTRHYQLNRHDLTLPVIGGGTGVESYYDADGGTTAIANTPVLPKTAIDVTPPSGVTLGAVLTSADITRLANWRPFTDIAAADAGGTYPSYVTANSYPRLPFALSLLAGQSLVLNQLQYRSDGGAVTGTATRYDHMTLRVYTTTASGAAAATASPTVTSTRLVANGTALRVIAVVASSADIEEVFATYTATQGAAASHLASVRMTAGPNLSTSGGFVREFVADIEAGSADALATYRVLLQAVGANGAVGYATNNGDLFSLAQVTASVAPALVPPKDTTVTLDLVGTTAGTPPTVSYDARLTARATLSDTAGNAVAGRNITFALGTRRVTATTDPNGNASGQFTVVEQPGPTQVTVSFFGDASYAGTGRATDIAVTRATTTLTPASPAPAIEYSDSAAIATLRAGSRTLGLAPVILAVGPASTATSCGAAICLATLTDPYGRVLLGTRELGLGAATYTVGLTYPGSIAYTDVTATTSVTIVREKATVAVTPTASGRSVTLGTTVTQEADGASGDITLSTLEFALSTPGTPTITATAHPAADGTVSLVVAVPQDGVYSVTATVTGGYFGPATATSTVTVDATAPTTTAVVTPAPNPNGWNSTDATVTLGATDNLAGVKEIHYSLSGAQSATETVVAGATASFGISADGTTTITFFAVDRFGNAETAKTLDVNVSTHAGASSASQSPAPNSHGWNNTNVTVTLTAKSPTTGDSLTIDYSLDGGAFVRYVGPIVISSNGVHALAFHSTDLAGNVESDQRLIVQVDKTPPAVGYTGNTSPYTVDQVIAIRCNATDNGSGIATSTCADISGPAYAFVGTTTYTATATDVAGNTSTGSTTVTVGVTYDGLAALTTKLSTNVGVSAALVSKLSAAKAAAARGDANAKAGQIAAFKNQLAAQSGKALTADQVALLTRLANLL